MFFKMKKYWEAKVWVNNNNYRLRILSLIRIIFFAFLATIQFINSLCFHLKVFCTFIITFASFHRYFKKGINQLVTTYFIFYKLYILKFNFNPKNLSNCMFWLALSIYYDFKQANIIKKITAVLHFSKTCW